MLLSVTSCGGEPRDKVDQEGSVSEALAPAGSNATFLGTTMKPSWYPGERGAVSVTMRNTGTNDWSPTAPMFALNSLDGRWGFTYAPVATAIHPGGTNTFSFIVAAPNAAGAQTFTATLQAMGSGGFGDLVTIPTTVSTASARQWGCTYLPGSSSLPATLAPGENRYVTVTVQNSGTDTWTSGFYLASHDSPANLWAQTNVALGASLGAGGTKTWGFSIRAPSTPGTYRFVRDMSNPPPAGIGFFQGSNSCVDVPVVVSGAATPDYGATVSSQSALPATTPGAWYGVTVAMKNTGSLPWQGPNFGLRSVSVPTNAWQTTFVPLGASDTVAPGDEHTFSFYVKAPSGAYSTAWRMMQTTGVGAFGETATNGGSHAGGTRDCADILSGNPALPNGVYNIDMDGSGPIAAFDVYCDMTHGGWTEVNDQDVSVAGGYLPIPTWLAGVNTTAPNAGQWGVLNRLSAFVRTTGDYELRLTYGQDESRGATWVQSGDPLSSSRGTVSSLSMTPANQIGCGVFNGLGSDAGAAAIDGNTGGCWWFAVGSNGSFGSGIPAYEGSAGGQLVTDRVRLYVRR